MVYKNLNINKEKKILSIIAVTFHRSFNETCLNNKLLPVYTNVNLHDEAVREEYLVDNFKKKLSRGRTLSKA